MWIKNLQKSTQLVVAVGSLVALSAQTQNPPPVSSSQVMTVNADSIQATLLELKVSFDSVKDADDLMSYHIRDGESTLCSIYQYTEGDDKEITSLGFTVGFDIPSTLLWRRVNEWNSTNRFAKVHLDAEGDPFLTQDIYVAGGVSQENLSVNIVRFIAASKKFQKEVLGREVPPKLDPTRP